MVRCERDWLDREREADAGVERAVTIYLSSRPELRRVDAKKNKK